MGYAVAKDFDRTLVVFTSWSTTYVRLINMNTDDARHDYEAVVAALTDERRRKTSEVSNYDDFTIDMIIPYAAAGKAYDLGPRAFKLETETWEETVVRERKVFK